MEEILAFLIIWIILAFIVAVAVAGTSRKLGFWSAFLLSFFLSPIIALIFTFLSGEKKVEKKISQIQISLINEGDILFKENKLSEAIEKYTSALTYSEKSPHTNFKLAKIYSILENGDNSLKHLSKAIQDGFDNFEVINNDKSLAYLRSIPEFKSFSINGYKLMPLHGETIKPISRIEELEKLVVLFEKGLLTKEEFDNEKNRILSLDTNK